MGSLGFAILLGFGGALAAALYTLVLGFAGAPGALFTFKLMKDSGSTSIPTSGLLVTLAGQLYAALAFVAFIIQTSHARLNGQSGPGNWIAWCITFVVAVAPPSIALKDSVSAEQRTVQHGATTLTAPLTAVGYFLFIFFPGLIRIGWGWVPHF